MLSSSRPAKHSPRNRVRLAALIAVLLGCIAFGVPQILLSRAKSQIGSRQFAAADSTLAWAQKFSPWNEDLALLRARCARRRGDVKHFAILLQSARDKGLPEQLYDLELQLVAAEQGQIEPLLARLAQGESSSLSGLAVFEALVRGALQRHDLPMAEQLISNWRVEHPGDPGADFYTGRIAEHKDNLQLAEEAFREALVKAPNHGPAAYNLARVLEGQNRYDEAVAAYEKAAAVLVEPHSALVGQARSLRLNDRLGDIEPLLTKALERPADSVEMMQARIGERSRIGHSAAKAELGHLELARGNAEKAVEWFEKALAENEYDWKTRYGYSTALREAGDPNAALEQIAIVQETQQAIEDCDALISALQTEPNNIEARIRIGQLMLNYISPDQGVRWLEEVIARDPQNEVARQALANHYRSVDSRSESEQTRLNDSNP